MLNDSVEVEYHKTLVVGSGVSGLAAAYYLDECTLLTSGALGAGGSTPWAQGGIAAAVSADDSYESHVLDTFNVSAGLSDKDVAREMIEAAPKVIDELIRIGAEFDKDGSNNLSLGREAGHSKRRIVRANGDSIGQVISTTLLNAILKKKTVNVIENIMVEELLTDSDGVRVIGVKAKQNGVNRILFAGNIILATGGYSYLYEKTTNQPGSIGAGIYLASRVGAKISDLEFVQFHPTALDVESSGSLPLLSEAIRGEGATLVDQSGVRFMPKYHKDAELAPRDVVARAIFQELSEGNQTYLNCVDSIGDEFPKMFPTVNQLALNAGFNPILEPLPVTPAAHYCMGGVASDAYGRTNITSLWVVGEAASTGLHGANRLASNSLLEGLVMGSKIAEVLELNKLAKVKEFAMPKAPIYSSTNLIRENELRKIMWSNVGLVRDEVNLITSLEYVEGLLKENSLNKRENIMASVSKLVIESALKRKESRGAHYRSDYSTPRKDLAKRSVWTGKAVVQNYLVKENFVDLD